MRWHAITDKTAMESDSKKHEAGRSLAPEVGAALRMQMLQGLHVHFPAL
jgi:hypothetical protein